MNKGPNLFKFDYTALNILKKEIPNAFDGYGIEVCSTPVVLTTK